MTDVHTTDIKQITALPDPEISEKKRELWYYIFEEHEPVDFMAMLSFLTLLIMSLLTFSIPANGTIVRITIIDFLLFCIFFIRAWRQHRRKARVQAANRAEYEDYKDLRARIHRFNVRLAALKEIAANVTEEKRPGPDVVAKYMAEHQELTMLLRPYADERLRKLQRTIADNDNPCFRTTRDVSDSAYVAQLRLADEDTGTTIEPLPEEDETEPTAARVGGA